MPTIAKIEPLTTARAVRGPFDYRVPDEIGPIAEGSLLVVPFAHRRVLGVVVGLADRSELDLDRLAVPHEALELQIPPELVRLALWVADAYCSTPARALGLVLPPGVGIGPAPKVKPRTALVAELTDAGRHAVGANGSNDRTVRLTDGQRGALELLTTRGALPAAESSLDHGGLRRLERRGLLTLERRSLRRAPSHAAIGARRNGRPELTSDQRAAVDRIVAALDSDAERRLLLHGVTGSGKTEVYLRAIEATLAAGRGAIVLVPEIALTPQTVARVRDRFGDTVAVVHSKLGRGERYDEWRRLHDGAARVCVGPRSAVFAPVADLGLIVIDEEHEAAYKHEGDPRYDARTVAERRAEDAGAVLVVGSATPRPESHARLTRVTLPTRVEGGGLPPVEIVDMRDAQTAIHPRTRDALLETRLRGEKAIVLLNRRGWSNFLSCRSCGQVWVCPNCDVALVLHRVEGEIACHHCGHRRAVPALCDGCGSTSVARHGAGTEQLEHELMTALSAPDFPIVRLDADATATRGQVEAALARFQDAPAGILMGTQMVAKGHDFPDVTLGVVLDADRTLRFPDFRAEERTFALIAQLAGRAGRGPAGGRVLVQTLAPDEPSIQLAARHDVDGFLAAELDRRRALRYPPYAQLVRVVCGSRAGDGAAAAAAAVRERLRIPGAQVLGPAPLFRLRGRDRNQIVVKVGDDGAAVPAIAAAVDEVARSPLGRNATISVDVDPQ